MSEQRHRGLAATLLPICPEDSTLHNDNRASDSRTHTTYMTNVFFTTELASFLVLGRIFKGANKCARILKISGKGKTTVAQYSIRGPQSMYVWGKILGIFVTYPFTFRWNNVVRLGQEPLGNSKCGILGII